MAQSISAKRSVRSGNAASAAIRDGSPSFSGPASIAAPPHSAPAIAIAARAAGILALDTPFLAFRDANGLRENSRASRGYGFRGRFAIHPAQIEAINQAYSPSEAEVEHARRVIAAFETAAQQGRGSTSLDGKVVDVPVVKRAQALLDLAMGMRSQAD